MEARHQFCPKTVDSWCKFQKDQHTGRNTYQAKTSISKVIRNKIRPVFTDLSYNEVLKKCLHGRTQDANEASNQIIWICPKNVYVQRCILEIGTCSAVSVYNDGTSGLKSLFEKLNISPGKSFFKVLPFFRL